MLGYVIFQRLEHASEGRVMAACMIYREHLTYKALGYRRREGEYLREKFDDDNDFLENARLMHSFDDLDR